MVAALLLAASAIGCESTQSKSARIERRAQSNLGDGKGVVARPALPLEPADAVFAGGESMAEEASQPFGKKLVG